MTALPSNSTGRHWACRHIDHQPFGNDSEIGPRLTQLPGGLPFRRVFRGAEQAQEGVLGQIGVPKLAPQPPLQPAVVVAVKNGDRLRNSGIARTGLPDETAGWLGCDDQAWLAMALRMARIVAGLIGLVKRGWKVSGYCGRLNRRKNGT